MSGDSYELRFAELLQNRAVGPGENDPIASFAVGGCHSKTVRDELPGLMLFTESLDVRLAVWIEEFLASLLPRCFEFRRCNVPILPAFFDHRAQILTKILHRRPAEEPVAHVDLVNDKTGFEHNRVRNHRIVDRISVLSDVEIFLDLAPRVGEERPVGTDSGAIFIRLSDVVGRDRYEPAIANLELTMQLDKPLRLSAILGTKTSAPEDENHWILSLQFRELPMFSDVIGKFVIGEHSPWNNVSSHIECYSDGYNKSSDSRSF